MTGRELMKWILDNNAEDLPFEVQYRDSGGDYHGTDERLYLIVEKSEKTVEDLPYKWQYTRVVL